MSVYTSVAANELKQLLLQYNLGELVDYQGISAGIQNTNYFLDTTKGRYVLTLFESLELTELNYFMNVMAHLADSHVPCAHPIKRLDNKYLTIFKNKPTAIVDRLPGAAVGQTNHQHACELGVAMGRMHQAGLSFTQKRNNDRGPHWWRSTINRLNGHIPSEDYHLVKTEINYQQTFSTNKLPRGMIHGDLFKDNTLWQGEKLTGIIDFYFACYDVMLFDLAVTANAWFFTANDRLDTEKTQIFLSEYNKHRPLLAQEKQAWPAMLRAAALRFWLSRLDAKYFPKEGEMTHIHNPDVFKQIITSHIANDQALKKTWID